MLKTSPVPEVVPESAVPNRLWPLSVLIVPAMSGSVVALFADTMVFSIVNLPVAVVLEMPPAPLAVFAATVLSLSCRLPKRM